MKPWPYPRTKPQVRRLLIGISLVVILAGLCWGFGLARAHSRSLGKSDVQRAAQELGTYISEAIVLTEQKQQGRSPENYQSEYFAHLQEQAQQLHAYLATHTAEKEAIHSKSILVEQSEQLTAITRVLPENNDATDLRIKLNKLRHIQAVVRQEEL
jgi:hypothetical protein